MVEYIMYSTMINKYMRCIYRIDIGQRYYIGSTKNFDNRKRCHIADLKKSRHGNKFLQNLYNKYGEEEFKFSVVEILNEDTDPLEVEQCYLDEHYGSENCVNLSPIVGGGFYYKRTPESIKKYLETKRKNGNWYPKIKRYPKEAIDANTGSKRCSSFREECKKHMKYCREKNSNIFKEAAKRGRDNRWMAYDKPFILIKDGVKYGPYRTQSEVFKTKILSQLSISRLFLGKIDKVKGYHLEFINLITK